MAVNRVVVEIDLGVEREQIAALGDNQRVDLQDRRVGGDEGGVERHHHLDALLQAIAAQAEREAKLLRLEWLQADAGVDEHLVDLLRRLFGDLLNLDAALLADHEDDALRGAIHHQAEIQLLVDGQALFHEQARNLLAVGTGLVGHERLTQ